MNKIKNIPGPSSVDLGLKRALEYASKSSKLNKAGFEGCVKRAVGDLIRAGTLDPDSSGGVRNRIISRGLVSLALT